MSRPRGNTHANVLRRYLDARMEADEEALVGDTPTDAPIVPWTEVVRDLELFSVNAPEDSGYEEMFTDARWRDGKYLSDTAWYALEDLCRYDAGVHVEDDELYAWLNPLGRETAQSEVVRPDEAADDLIQRIAHGDKTRLEPVVGPTYEP